MALKKLLAQGIFWRSVYFFSVLLVNVFLSRYLQAAGTGSLYLTSIIFSFMQVLLSLGGEAGVTYFASANTIPRNSLVILTACWSIVAGLLMAAFVWLYFLITGNAGTTETEWYCLYGFTFVFGLSLGNYGTAIYYTKENFYLPNLLLSAANLLFVFIIPGKDEPHNTTTTPWILFLYFATFAVGGWLIFMFYFFQNRREGNLHFPKRGDFFQFVKYSFTALGASAIFFLVYRIDYLFVHYSPVCTPADLGNYIQVSKIGQLMLTIPLIIASVVFPKTASGEDEQKMNNALMIMSRIFSQLFLLIFTIVAIFGKQFFEIIFGESFDKMRLPMLILIPGIFALSVLTLISAYFSGKGKVRINLYAAIIGLVFTIIGDFIFVPKYGIIAAALVSTISYIANAAFATWHYHKEHSISVLDFFKWKSSDYNWLINYIKSNKKLIKN